MDYLRPENSGGLFIDMGIHDFDLARWFMGDVASVFSAGGVLAYPEMAGIGDRANALTNLRFANGCIGMVSLSRNRVYGYGIYTEIVGTEGTIRIGYDRHTPVLVMTADAIAHDTAFEYRLAPRALPDVGVPSFVNGVLELNGIWTQRSEQNGGKIGDSGGYTVFVSPGLQYVTQRWVAEISVQLLLIQELNGSQLKTDYILSAEFRVQF